MSLPWVRQQYGVSATSRDYPHLPECTNPECDGCDPDPEPVECPHCDGTGAITGDRFVRVDCGECTDGVIEP